jgi:hypothetical protein
MRIVGVVKNSKNAVKIRDANIKLIVDSIELASVFSDENGGFEYRTDTDFTGKNLKLKIEKEGFESKSISFEIGSDVQDEEFEIKLTQKEEKTKVKIDKEAEIVKPEPSFDIEIGKDGINIGISSLSIPVKIAIGIIAIAFVVFLALPAIEEKSSLSITPDPLSFNIGDVNANETISRTFSISNPGKETLNWKVTADQSWANIKPTSGVDSGTISIDINTAGLRPGSYAGIISIISNHGEKSGAIAFNIPQNPVPPTPQSPILNVSKKSLIPESTSVGDTKVDTLQISNTGSGTLDWQAKADKPWIELSKTSGTNEGSIIVTLNSAGLAPGKYIGTIIFASNGGTESVIIDFNVVAPIATTPAVTTPAVTPTPTPTITVSPQVPLLSVSPYPLSFNLGTLGAGSSLNRTFDISNAGGEILMWNVSSDIPWISVDPKNGANSGTVNININTIDVTPRDYSGTITVNSNGGQISGSVNLILIPVTYSPYKVFENEGLLVICGLTADGVKDCNTGGGYYAKVGQDIALNGNPMKLAKLVLEMQQLDKKTMTTGETWSLGSGYELTINAIDARASPRQVWFSLKKDGVVVDEGIGQAPASGAVADKQKAVCYMKKTILGESDSIFFTIYVDSIFSGSTSDMVQFKYLWLIDENSAKEIK